MSNALASRICASLVGANRYCLVLDHPSPTLRKKHHTVASKNSKHKMTKKDLQPTDLEKNITTRPKENENEWTYSKKGKRTRRKGQSGLESFMEYKYRNPKDLKEINKTIKEINT
jgi:hypothetical protein